MPMFQPTVSREEVFKALFALSSGLTWNIGTVDDPVLQGFSTRTRRIKLFSDVGKGSQPWLGQAEHNESSRQTSGKPYSRTWTAQWMVYHRAGDNPGFEPTIWNNLILDAVELAVAPQVADPGFFENRNTLFGKVYHCYIDGEVFKDPGDIDNQALLIVPFTILVP